MATAGRILIIPKGKYKELTPYETLDMVSYGGKGWVCKKTCVGITPEDGDYWGECISVEELDLSKENLLYLESNGTEICPMSMVVVEPDVRSYAKCISRSFDAIHTSFENVNTNLAPLTGNDTTTTETDIEKLVVAVHQSLKEGDSINKYYAKANVTIMGHKSAWSRGRYFVMYASSMGIFICEMLSNSTVNIEPMVRNSDLATEHITSHVTLSSKMATNYTKVVRSGNVVTVTLRVDSEITKGENFITGLPNSLTYLLGIPLINSSTGTVDGYMNLYNGDSGASLQNMVAKSSASRIATFTYVVNA